MAVYVFGDVPLWFYDLLGLCANRSEGFALTGYVVPGCVEDGAWMLWGNVSVAVIAVVAVVARFCFDIFGRCCQNTFFHDWAPYGRWGAHRTMTIRVVAMRVLFVCIIKQFPDPWTFHVLSSFFEMFVEQILFTQIIQKCLGALGGHPRPIPSHF